MNTVLTGMGQLLQESLCDKSNQALVLLLVQPPPWKDTAQKASAADGGDILRLPTTYYSSTGLSFFAKFQVLNFIATQSEFRYLPTTTKQLNVVLQAKNIKNIWMLTYDKKQVNIKVISCEYKQTIIIKQGDLRTVTHQSNFHS